MNLRLVEQVCSSELHSFALFYLNDMLYVYGAFVYSYVCVYYSEDHVCMALPLSLSPKLSIDVLK